MTPTQEHALLAAQDEMKESLGRLERALLGDPSIGHPGLVRRLENIENDHARIAGEHSIITEARADGDRRAHERIDTLAKTVHDQITALETVTEGRADGIERKIDRFIWLAAGGAAAALAAGFGLGWAASPNLLPIP